MAIFLHFVVKTALIVLVLGGFFCVLSQSESICNLQSCCKRTALLSQPIRIEYFCRVYYYKNNNIIKRFYIENSPLDGTVQSGQSAIMQYAG